jgi:hypothetical protein
VRSTALLIARQVYPRSARVMAFGWEDTNFKDASESIDMRRAFELCGVEFI